MGGEGWGGAPDGQGIRMVGIPQGLYRVARAVKHQARQLHRGQVPVAGTDQRDRLQFQEQTS